MHAFAWVQNSWLGITILAGEHIYIIVQRFWTVLNACHQPSILAKIDQKCVVAYSQLVCSLSPLAATSALIFKSEEKGTLKTSTNVVQNLSCQEQSSNCAVHSIFDGCGELGYLVNIPFSDSAVCSPCSCLCSSQSLCQNSRHPAIISPSVI